MPLHPAVFLKTVQAATHRALAARDRLVADYPDWQDWREAARAQKAQAVAHLDEFLARLTREVQARGGEVLFARDAWQARERILEVARRHGVKAVVKSKSMTAEEIGLTPYLEAAGLAVTETDLGEFIVHLAGEPPAHLTAPALHLDRQRIACLFADHLGWDCPPEPEALCRAASRHLKDRYAQAQMGVTGVNFALPDGTLVCLENEGNLRQTAAMPPVHLALMGAEKILPDIHGLSACLPLLPASATGQRLTSLVHFLKGLKTGPAGRQAFYLVILDNGRRRLAADPDFREALHCLRCGACLNICPVFQAGGAHLYGRVYPGAIGILLASYLAPLGDISELCTQCGACGEICPAAIALPEKIRLVRQKSPRFRRLRLASGAAGFLLSRPPFYRRTEGVLRLLQRNFPAISANRLLGAELAATSFHASLVNFTQTFRGKGLGAKTPLISPRNGERAGEPRPPAPPPKADRFHEAGSAVHEVRGPGGLARLLKALVQGPLFLEDHPWLASLAPELAGLGVEAQVARDLWAPEADTVVTVGLGAVPGTGTVLLPPAAGLAAWLPFRARQQVVLLPRKRANLSLPDALALTARQGEGLTSWLTGPTRTADIEKVLVLGAQGPAALSVVVYDPDSGSDS